MKDFTLNELMNSGRDTSEKPQPLAVSVERLVINPLLPLLTHIYNTGYNNGHNDTVESCYTDVLPIDMETYQGAIVAELVADLLGL